MDLLLTDLVIRLSKADREVVFCIPQRDKPSALHRFYALKIDNFASDHQLANELGIALVAFLKSHHKDIFPDDQPTNFGPNDPSSDRTSLDDARLLIERIDDNSKPEDLAAIDVLLRHAANGGDIEATRYLEDTWPKLRDVLTRRLKRGR